MKRRGFVIAAIVVLVAGCGGGGGGGRLAHAQFVARADALCRAAIAQARAVPKPHSLSELTQYLARVRPIQVRFLQRARRLRPPQRDEADWRRAIAFDERVLHLYDLMAAAGRRHDAAAAGRITQRLQALPERNPYERKLGMKGC